MKKFLVISDTHQLTGEKVLEVLEGRLSEVDAVIHCGDVVGLPVLEALEEVRPVIAVAGNMDSLDIKRRYPKREILQVGDVRIGVIHGWGSPHGIVSKILYAFRDEKVDAIFFGHTHERFHEVRDGIHLINPGSLLDRVFTPVNSYALVEVASPLRVEFVEIERS